MRSPITTCLYLTLFGSIILFTSACDNKGKNSGEESGIYPVDAEELDRNRAQIDQGLSQKKEWQDHWSKEVGDIIDGSLFELTMTDSIDSMEMPEKNPVLKDDPLFPYQFPHPGGDGVIDIYSYKVVTHAADDTAYLSPDAEVAWYRRDGMKERLLFMGPSGMFEDGIWLNEQEFLVFGYFHGNSGFRPMAWLINVDTHLLKQFQLVEAIDDYLPQSYIKTKIKLVGLR
ncbi:hypothetical protein LZF95_03865 [Algoriphagus sp. AGSA1]|uniref:hypothetical protein n=1 Tax=Algoriphagus sp. AGSA1 TaxID=2907213 RepID=UPI001F27C915|nr:hypothetical protein [Algoriphagus sp. AGSA1]MCE7053803.1 hypothetical protein [Algoriphagus sp. AGSA1]